jgi:hypothetical protein
VEAFKPVLLHRYEGCSETATALVKAKFIATPTTEFLSSPNLFVFQGQNIYNTALCMALCRPKAIILRSNKIHKKGKDFGLSWRRIGDADDVGGNGPIWK